MRTTTRARANRLLTHQERGTPHVCFDATSYTPAGKGAATYTYELLGALHALDASARVTVIARESVAQQLQARLAGWVVVPKPVRSALAWHLFGLPRFVAEIAADVVHVLHETPIGRMPVPYCMSVHELPELRRRYSADDLTSLYSTISSRVTERLLPQSCCRAGHLFALSESTARDLAHLYGVPSGHISVVYPGVSRRFFQPDTEAPSEWIRRLPTPYVLTFATGDGREIPEQAIEAFGSVFHQIPHTLVVAGRCPARLCMRLQALVTRAGCQDRVAFTGYVPEAELPALYRSASVYVDLSRYEGFGLQVAEAMAAGTPTIATAIPAIAEVVGPTGYVVQAGDAQSLADQLLELLLTPESELRFSRDAFSARAATFRWETAAQKVWSTIEAMLQ